MKIENNEVVTLVTMTGEYVGRLKEQDTHTITLTNPRLFMTTQEGAGFLPGISMTGEESPEESRFNSSMITAVLKTSETVKKAWIQQTTGLVV